MNTQGRVPQSEAARIRAVRLVEEEGWSTVDAAKAVGCSQRSVQLWLKAFRESGGEWGVLATKPKPGARPKLDDEQRARLLELLEAGPVACGFAEQTWTGRRIAELIRREFGVTYNDRFVPTLLRKLGFSRQRPRKRAMERDEERIAKWIHVDWPRVKKRHADSGQRSSGSTNRAS